MAVPTSGDTESATRTDNASGLLEDLFAISNSLFRTRCLRAGECLSGQAQKNRPESNSAAVDTSSCLRSSDHDRRRLPPYTYERNLPFGLFIGGQTRDLIGHGSAFRVNEKFRFKIEAPPLQVKDHTASQAGMQRWSGTPWRDWPGFCDLIEQRGLLEGPFKCSGSASGKSAV